MITTIIIRLTIYFIVVCCGNGWIGLGHERRARHAVVKPPIKYVINKRRATKITNKKTLGAVGI